MEPDDIVNKIIEGLTRFRGKVNVVNHEIDVHVQLKYFDFSRSVQVQIGEEDLEERITELNTCQNFEKQKELLVALSHKVDVKAFRAIENFEKGTNGEIQEWARMALAEAKMLLEGELLGENQLFISTGLGGSGSSFRYFIVLFANSENSLEEFQCKIVKNEINFIFKEYNAKLEEIEFINNFVTIVALIPFETPINNVFNRAIDASNEFGNFMSYNFLINNAKRMTPEEIKEFVDKEKENIMNKGIEFDKKN